MAFVSIVRRSCLWATVTAGFAALPALAQSGTAEPAAPEVGQIAPDFTLPGATRFGLLRDSVRLSDYRGNTVVLAFFFKARTKG